MATDLGPDEFGIILNIFKKPILVFFEPEVKAFFSDHVNASFTFRAGEILYLSGRPKCFTRHAIPPFILGLIDISVLIKDL
jgi:hypothetical protein